MPRAATLFLMSLPAALVAQSTSPITATLHPVTPTSGVSVRWSPKGATVPLKLSAGSLAGSFTLGPSGSRPIAVRLAKSPGAPHYNTLWIDVNRDGKLGPGEKLVVEPKLIRGKWWSSFDTIVEVPNESAGPGGATTRPYPMALWYVEDPVEPDSIPALRWSRRGWHAGTVEVDGKPAWVMITELEMDGVFDQRDAWAMSRDSAKILGADSRKLDEHTWMDGAAYRPVRIDPDGLSLSFAAIVPGTSEAEEAANRDIYLPDRGVVRANKPLSFGKDLASALATARRSGGRVLVDFEAVWCGPCHVMDSLVFTAASIVDAAKDVIPVKVDGDEHRDLKKAWKVDGYPTLILLDSSGHELRRGTGYQSVKDMLAMLKP